MADPVDIAFHGTRVMHKRAEQGRESREESAEKREREREKKRGRERFFSMVYCRFTNRPPSTNSWAPVTYPLSSSQAKNTAGPAMSAGVPVRPNGVLASM